MSRPLKSRQVQGYATDLAHLARLRSAALGDPRVSHKQYEELCQAVQKIEKILRTFKS